MIHVRNIEHREPMRATSRPFSKRALYWELHGWTLMQRCDISFLLHINFFEILQEVRMSLVWNNNVAWELHCCIGATSFIRFEKVGVVIKWLKMHLERGRKRPLLCANCTQEAIWAENMYITFSETHSWPPEELVMTISDEGYVKASRRARLGQKEWYLHIKEVSNEKIRWTGIFETPIKASWRSGNDKTGKMSVFKSRVGSRKEDRTYLRVR